MSLADQELVGHTALVTGAAGSGIGGAIVGALAARGAAILAVDRSADDLERSHETWVRRGWTAFGEVADVTDEPSLRRALAALSRHRGAPTIVVNSAAKGALAPLVELEPAEWAQIMAMNVTAVANVIRLTIDGMVAAGGGAIVNVSSLAAVLPPAGAPAYAASKAALNSLTRSVAIDYGPYGVRCNAVAPGPVRTPYVARHIERMAAEIAAIPLGRLAEPEEVAEAVCFLASDRASYISGHVLVLSGGRPG